MDETFIRGGELEGKLCLVTGATSGIGKVTACVLAQRGAQVVLVGRNPAKTEATRCEIQAASGNPAVDALVADFSDLPVVEALAQRFLERCDRLDVLVNNAGAYFNRRHVCPNGVERTFQVNHLAHFLLTLRLLPLLQASAPARIVNVASAAHHYGSLDFDDLGFKRGYFGMQAYGRSKLANILFTYELARRLQGSGVSANAVHPGEVATDIWRTNFPLIGPLLKRMIGLFGLTPEQGAEPLIYLACSPEVEGVSGKYFIRMQEARSSALSCDQALARRLWEQSERLLCPPGDWRA